ncbi:MAG TPA: CDP-alcohol phosphatidyltransferase family protein [Myxococcota bacterium]|nr:CDP-alcohol phosphatidyltransferase family protein [Myxococcota bacterium]
MSRLLVALPALVTASRGLAGPVILALVLVIDRPWPAFWLFTFAMLTDLIDGWLARQVGADPELGALLDPLADKLIVGCSWLALGLRGWAPWWLVLPGLLRDVIVAGIWRLVRGRGVLWRPSKLGQVATSYEGTAIGILLFHGPWNGVHWPSVGVAVGVCALALSLGSAVAYAITGPPEGAT